MWDEEDIAVLLDNASLSLDELHKLLPWKTKSAIASKRCRLNASPPKKRWTEAEKATLALMYGVVEFQKIQEEFPSRTEGSIRSQVAALKKSGKITRGYYDT